MKITYSVNGKKKTIHHDATTGTKMSAALGILWHNRFGKQHGHGLEPYWEDLERKGMCVCRGVKYELIKWEATERENRNEFGEPPKQESPKAQLRNTQN